MRKLFFLFFILFFSCQKDIYNLTISGIVKDIELDSPIEGAKIKLWCWKYNNSPDESYADYEIKTVTTNESGEYEVFFDKGAYLELKIRANGYKSQHIAEYIGRSNITMNIDLKHN